MERFDLGCLLSRRPGRVWVFLTEQTASERTKTGYSYLVVLEKGRHGRHTRADDTDVHLAAA